MQLTIALTNSNRFANLQPVKIGLMLMYSINKAIG